MRVKSKIRPASTPGSPTAEQREAAAWDDLDRMAEEIARRDEERQAARLAAIPALDAGAVRVIK
jgi:hypothetical protein